MWAQLPPFILASASPRRRELLQQIGIMARILASDIVEQSLPNEAPEAYVSRNAALKGETIKQRIHGDSGIAQNAMICSADTIVVLDGAILEKPASPQEACFMLEKLSGREHEVLTAFCLERVGIKAHWMQALVRTTVKFRTLDQATISGYVASGEPMDKAGAYGAQGMGGTFIATIQGSYSNVVGLPIAETVSALQEHFDISAFR
jgi:septum formation protein